MVDESRPSGPKISQRQPGANFDLYESDHSIRVYVDGAAGMGIGTGVSRIDFYQVKSVTPDLEAPGNSVEIREGNLTIIMPTPAFLEFLAVALQGSVANQGALTAAFRLQADSFAELLKQIAQLASPANK